MLGERIPEGWLVRLRPCGAGRFVSAAFLCFWLCGWAVGEFIVLSILAKGVLAIMTGMPPDPGANPLEVGPALGVGVFLLFWLGLWTLGGVAAMYEVLRLLWSEDRLIAHAGGLTVARSCGPFRRRREFPRDTLRQIMLVPRHDALAIETVQGMVELSLNGSRAERQEAADALRSELRLIEAPPEAEGVALPQGWEEVITAEGERAVVVDSKTRKIQARVVAVLTLLVAAVSFAIFQESQRELALLPVAILAALAAIGLGWGTAWLARGRMEWRVGNGRLVLRRRFGSEAKDLFEAQRLELTVTSDSDGDEWFALEAITGSAETPSGEHWSHGKSKNRRRVASVLHDPVVPRSLGAWLSRAANVPFDDRTSRESRDAEWFSSGRCLRNPGPWDASRAASSAMPSIGGGKAHSDHPVMGGGGGAKRIASRGTRAIGVQASIPTVQTMLSTLSCPAATA